MMPMLQRRMEACYWPEAGQVVRAIQYAEVLRNADSGGVENVMDDLDLYRVYVNLPVEIGM